MQDPIDPRLAMIAALQRGPQGQQVAGDVVPLPMQPTGGATGPTPLSAPYVTGQMKDPKIAPIPMSVLEAWMNRTTARR